MGFVIMEHPDGRRREFPTVNPERIVALLQASEWTPDPLCPCCKVKTVTVDGVTYTATDIETIYSEP